MDGLGALLDGPRAERAFLLKAVFAGGWSVGIEDEAPLSVAVMARGSAVYADGAAAHPLDAGDVVLVRGPEPYVFADSPQTPTEVRILPGQVCVDPQGHIVQGTMDLGVRTWGNVPADTRHATVILIGTYNRETSVGARLLARLPRSVVLRGVESPLVDLLSAEVVNDRPGQEAVLDRLLDLLLVSCLREALAGADDRGWLAAEDDAVVGPALRLIHERPEEPWTVASLARRAGVSRAVFARRFNDRVGEPPLTYLTGWRMALAADLIAGTDRTLAAVAARVGYANPFALSAAFKRAYGVSPAHFRARHSAA
ncbi:AraC-like DNA-binding protein [Murinocardiopsis flavida]|uniref:AraC-like DNA-binding protein n=1 Tax=Murinocardiopsis flavida TaxID=645275 RepID=A0A2P8CR92_9ACTN|nr:AraC family transcriptional regulator [Murinocardiopsis flavida]PSK87485.1 AraC-like DNA-binding protein [Murinocardiopsis flavida]